MIDATIVRCHACTAAYGDQASEGLGRRRGGFSCKIHTQVDAGNRFQFIISAGQSSQITQAKYLHNDVYNFMLLQIALMVLQKLKGTLKVEKHTVVVPSQCNAVTSIEYDTHI